MTGLNRLCSWPGCGELVPIRDRYCEIHQEAADRRKQSDKRPWRPPSSQRGYDYEWKKIRAAVLRERPYCEKCKTVRSREIHHLVSLSSGGTNDRLNLVALCKKCHTAITNRSRGG